MNDTAISLINEIQHFCSSLIDKEVDDTFFDDISDFFKNLPGTRYCVVCIKSYSYYNVSNGVVIKECPSCNDDVCIGEECVLFGMQDYEIIDIKTNTTSFGFFVFALTKETVFFEIEPFIRNMSNLLALKLENLRIKEMAESRKDTVRLVGKRLSKAAGVLLEKLTFEQAAQVIFDQYKESIGAKSGYIALLSDDGEENKVVYLDAGGLSCVVDPSLPMPIRGLRGIVYKTGKVAYDNDFMHSEWVTFMPKGHVLLKNVMFAPMNIEGRTVGLIGIANKTEDFNDDDARIAEAFGEIAAVALKKSLMQQEINQRMKELRCLYKMSQLIDEHEGDLDELFQSIVMILPESFLYDEVTCARIIFDDKVYATKNYKETDWVLQNDLIIHDQKRGVVEVRHLETIPYMYKGVFLEEEEMLLKAVAERLTRLIERSIAVADSKVIEDHQRSLRFQLKSLWDLAKMQESDLRSLCLFVLDTIVEISQSKYGFFGFVDENEEDMTVFSWSENVMDICKVKDKPLIFPIKSAGLWAEAIRNKKIMIVNDYSQDHKGKLGFPDGHVALSRLLVVPIISKGHVVSVGAVANKDIDYTQNDSIHLQSFMSNAQLIIDRKQAEEVIKTSLAEKEVLLQEIHHRVKNNMQIISSMLGLQVYKTKEIKVKEILNNSKMRIRAMALVHEKLYRSKDFSMIDFNDYIKKFIHELKAVYKGFFTNLSVEIDSKDVFLGIDNAIPCGLIITELLTNSIKYAFKDRDEKKIIIKFYKENKHYKLSIGDNGIGLPEGLDVNKSGTLGLEIVASLVYQLGGVMTVERENGTCFIIDFPEREGEND